MHVRVHRKHSVATANPRPSKENHPNASAQANLIQIKSESLTYTLVYMYINFYVPSLEN